MSEKIKKALNRRDALKLAGGAVLSTAAFVVSKRVRSAPKQRVVAGYGAGRYGTGKYGKSVDRYSVYMPSMRKE